MPRIAVGVPVPFLDALTYAVPPHLDTPPVGARVKVPLGRRVVIGCVVAHLDDDALPTGPTTSERQATSQPSSDPPVIKEIVDVVDREPLVPANVVELCRWVADYYMAGIGDALTAAMPPGARRRASGFRIRRVAYLGTQTDVAPGEGAARLTAKQSSALEMLAGAPAGLPVAELRGRGVTAATLTRLAARGLVVLRAEAKDRDPFAHVALSDVGPPTDRLLTEEQTRALAVLQARVARRNFHVALLRGVTGSGKTEIYLRLARQVVAMGRRVLMLVPEIALAPSAAAHVRAAFGARVAIQHSALSDGERHDQWQRIRRGDVDVVVGTRSAVFAPLDGLGLIVVDEEHDASYKQEETPRYNGRDVAVLRASREQALVVLGSATPSMETAYHAAAGKYASVVLERRVLDRPLAGVRLVNMRDEYAAEGPDVVISRALAEAVEQRLARHEQVLVLLNRRGYATAVFCRQCGDAFDCPNCSVSLTVHRAPMPRSRAAGADARPRWRARCHYCDYSIAVPVQCRKCAAPYLEQAGFGTAKVDHHLRERFPEARIVRIDRDTVRRKGALASMLSRFAAGEVDVLVGTQMIAKGHDFPNVTLVGVVSADVGLGLADFRAAERTFQLLTQVAGRAGRGERAGEAIVQTLYPNHYSIQLACRQDFPGFYEKELAFRRAMRYPPLVSLVNVVVRGRSFEEAMETASEIVRQLEPAGAFAVLGPAPAPLQRLRAEHRVQFFLKGSQRSRMRSELARVLAEMPAVRKRVTIDVDPLSVL